MKTKSIKTRLLTALLTLCMVLPLVSISAYAEDQYYLPEGVTYAMDYKHTYHTQVNVTAHIYVKDSAGTVVEATQASKSS